MGLICQNCGSTDVVTIQGQNFCINCGEQVAGSPSVSGNNTEVKSANKKAVTVNSKATKPKEAVIQAKTSAPAAEKVLVGVGPKDSVSTASADSVVPVIRKSSTAKTSVEKSPTITRFGSAAKKTDGEVNAPVKKVPTVVNPAKKITPIKPAQSSDSSSVVSSVKIDASAPVTELAPKPKPEPTQIIPRAKTTSSIDKPEDFLRPYPMKTPWDGNEDSEAKSNAAKKKTVTDIPKPVKASTNDDNESFIKPHPFSFTFKVGSSVGVTLGLLVGGAMWLSLDRDLLAYTIGLCVAIFFGVLVVAQAALLYGLSRVQDGRPAERKLWWRAGRSAFLECMNVNLVALILLSVCGLAGMGVWQLVQSLAGNQYWQIAAGLVGYGAVAWITLGALAARHIALPAVVIGGLNAVEATRLGWKAFLHAGGHLVLAMIETAVIRLSILLGLIVALVAGGALMPNLSGELVSVVAGLVVAVGSIVWYWLVLQIEARIWLKQYRNWVRLLFPEQKLRLLSGRIQSNRQR